MRHQELDWGEADLVLQHEKLCHWRNPFPTSRHPQADTVLIQKEVGEGCLYLQREQRGVSGIQTEREEETVDDS